MLLALLASLSAWCAVPWTPTLGPPVPVEGVRGFAPVSEGPVEIQVVGDDLWRVEGERRRPLTGGEDRFFGSVVSPAGDQVAFVGLSTGVHVLDLASGRIHHLGPGTAPCWTPDGRWVVFERTRDSGERVVASELRAWREDLVVSVPLTRTPGVIERRPAVSADGRWLSWEQGGERVAAPVRWTP